MNIIEGELEQHDVVALIEFHTREMFVNSPPGTSYALDLSGLLIPELSFYTLRNEDGDLMGCAALKELSDTHGEIKSMRTADAHLRKGVAKTLLEHIIAESRKRGYQRLSLETGMSEAFVPANKLYAAFGFELGEVFGDYHASDFNIFYHLDL